MVDPLTIHLQSSITVLKAQPIISGRTDYCFVDSVGMLSPGPGVEAHFLRVDESEADVNEVDKLYVRSECHCVAMGYWNDEKLTREEFVDGCTSES